MPELVGEPEWTGERRGRVLIEAVEWHHRQSLSRFLESQGFEPVACPGPQGADERCALATHGCAAAEQADVIVHALGPSDLRNREALRALRNRAQETPVIVEVSQPVAERSAVEYEGCTVLHPPSSNWQLLAAIENALGARP